MRKLFALLLLCVPALAQADDLIRMEPCRILDTRGAVGRASDSAPISFQVRGPNVPDVFQGGAPGCDTPLYATGVFLNVAAVNPGGPGHVFIYPFGSVLPTYLPPSRMNIPAAHANIANEIFVDLPSLASGGWNDVTIQPAASIVDSDFVVDVVGYTTPAAILTGEVISYVNDGSGRLDIQVTGHPVIYRVNPAPALAGRYAMDAPGLVGEVVMIHGAWDDDGLTADVPAVHVP